MTTLVTRATKTSTLTHNELDANFVKAAQTKAANYTVVEGDNRDTIELTAVATITLPTASAIVTPATASNTGDFEVTLKNISGVDCTITCNDAADTIEGSTSDFTLADDDCITLKVNQTADGYNIISGGVTATGTMTLTNKTLTNSTVITRETAVTLSSDASIEFTSIPSLVKRITVMLYEVALSTTSDIIINMGDSAGYNNASNSNTGFLTGTASSTLLTDTTSNVETGALIDGVTSAGIYSGSIVFENIDSAGTIWVYRGALSDTANDKSHSIGGSCETRGAQLDSIQIIPDSGNLATGTINIMYEG